MVDTPEESNGNDATEDNHLEKKTKRRRQRRRSKARQSKNSNNGTRKNNTPDDSNNNDDPVDPAIEQDEPGDGKHSPEKTSDDADPEGKLHQPVSGEDNSPDVIILEKHLEQENLHRRLIATARSLKKQKQRLKAAQDTLNRRWNKVLDTEEKYGADCHTKSYPKCKLLPEFDDEAIEPIQPKTTDQPD